MARKEVSGLIDSEFHLGGRPGYRIAVSLPRLDPCCGSAILLRAARPHGQPAPTSWNTAMVDVRSSLAVTHNRRQGLAQAKAKLCESEPCGDSVREIETVALRWSSSSLRMIRAASN
jgi:hypothetical protein